MRWAWILMLAFVAIFAVPAAIEGNYRFAIAYALVGLAIACWLFPWQGGRSTTHAEAVAAGGRGVVIYWRPGCVFCARLRGRLGRHGKKATWVNIWQDEDAAAFVRSHNDGNETVPTVVIDGFPQTNPDPQLVLDRLLEGSPR